MPVVKKPTTKTTAKPANVEVNTPAVSTKPVEEKPATPAKAVEVKPVASTKPTDAKPAAKAKPSKSEASASQSAAQSGVESATVAPVAVPESTSSTEKKRAGRKQKEPAAKTEEGDGEAEEGAQESGRRYFKILNESIDPPLADATTGTTGRYSGRNPMQAAKKAFKQICRRSGQTGNYVCRLTIQECTHSSQKRQFTYDCRREKLDTPQQVKKADTSYSINFRTHVKAYKAPASEGAAPKAKAKGGKAKAAPKKRVPKPKTEKAADEKAPAEKKPRAKPAARAAKTEPVDA